MKRVRQHITFFAIAAALTLAVFVTIRSDHLPFRLTMATAYSSMAFLVGTLLVGPLNVLRDRPNPVSTNLRRDLGIWGAILGLLHIVTGLQVHLRGQMWAYFIDPNPRFPSLPVPVSAFGFANYSGALAGLVLVLLLALSNDVSLRKLRPPRWKTLQRANYVGMTLIILHGFAYQIAEKRQWVFVAVYSTLVLVALGYQLAGYRRVRQATRRPAPPGSA